VTLFGKLRRYIRNLGLNDEKAWNPSLWSLAGTQSLSGETVTEHTALTYSAVWDAVNLISNTTSALPLHLMQRKGQKKRIADDRKLYSVLHDQANEYMTAMIFRKVMMSHILTWGNGYAEIVRNGYGEVVALWPITPNRVRLEMDEERKLFYRIRVDSQDVILPRERVLHVTGPSFDGFLGYSVIAMARKSIGLGMAMESFGSMYFGSGTHPGVIVSHPMKMDPVTKSNLQTALTDSYSGLGKSHKLMLLEEGMKLESVGIPPEDSQFLESRQFQIPEVARWFGVPPHKLKDLSKSSFNNIEQEQMSFVVDSILPWLVLLEQNYMMQLLTPSDRNLTGNGRYYFKHVLEGLLRGDSASRAKFYQVLWGLGALSSNDIRALEDWDPVPGGDQYFVPLNYAPIGMVQELLRKKSEPAPPPQLPAPDDNPPDEGGNEDE
jgi:HK97 family phage portal protein